MMYFKIPTQYENFVLNFGTEEYLPGKALDLQAGKQSDGSYIVSQEVTQYIREHLNEVLAYVTPRNKAFATKIQFIVNNFTANDFELITEEEARANLLTESLD